MKIDILAIGVHPDDVELACSGTLLHHIALGKKVGLLDLTRGELGTRGTASTRDEEAANAAKIMGAEFRINLNMKDGFFQYNEENIRKIIPVIRDSRPDVILSNAIDDRHPDHGRAAKLISDACFLAGLDKIKTTDKTGKEQKRWRPKAHYHYIQDYFLKPDFVVDITPYIEKKIELILTFKTQFFDPNSKELETPISGKDFLSFIKARNMDYGRPAGFTYGEGFTAERTPGVRNLFDLV